MGLGGGVSGGKGEPAGEGKEKLFFPFPSPLRFLVFLGSTIQIQFCFRNNLQ